MLRFKDNFLKKKILIYGLGKSGLSVYKFLKKKSETYLYDDKKNLIKNSELKKKIIDYKKINKQNFDYIIISPGIDIKKCKLSKYLKKNNSKINTDLDIFYSIYNKNKNITITGTNGKSTVAKILNDILKDQKIDTRLVGNIGNPILSEKKIKRKTIFIIEASSYQIEYSKKFKANYATILNLSPDHLERHGTFSNYIKSKFRLIKNQTNKDYSFLNKKNKYLEKEIQRNKINSKIINVNNEPKKKYLSKIKNKYFLTYGGKQNLSHVLAISDKMRLNKKKLIKTINKFKGLNYRQELVFNSKKISIINDSKSTSFSSSENILSSLKKVYWIVGGIPKKGDKFSINKSKCLNFKAYIFGNNKKYFLNKLKGKMKCYLFSNLKKSLIKAISDLNLESTDDHKTILFSPSAASFDTFKNFEDRGKKFNELLMQKNIKKKIYGK
jgi:UDP-N-acetylmuramoylalanine--D-glutamate ligase